MADITIKDLAAGTPSALDLLIFANPTTGVAKKTTIQDFIIAFSIPNTSNPEPGFYPFLSATEANTFESSGLKQIDGNYRIVLSDRGNFTEYDTSLFTLDSITNGFLKPRMTTTQRNAIASPAIGLEVYDTTLNLPYYYNGTAWIAISGGGSAIWGAITGTLSAQTDLQTALNGKQATLVSGTNIKTINSTSILGSGNIIISGGITTLNTLTALTQTFAVGSAGTDFTIDSATAMHTFNIPTASATARGLLSSANWTTFNSKVGGSGTANYLAKFTASGTIGNSLIYDNGTSVGIGTTSLPSSYKLIVNGAFNLIGQTVIQDDGGGISFYDTAGVVPTGQLSYNKYVGIYFYSQLAIPVKFGVNNAEVARFSTNGNLLINTLTDVTSSKFTIVSTSQGSIPLPRMTTAQIKAISSPVNGLMAYSTDEFTPCFYDSNAARWEKISHSIL